MLAKLSTAEFGRVNRSLSSEVQYYHMGAHVQIWLLHQLHAVYIDCV